jgi:hypothetical protein
MIVPGRGGSKKYVDRGQLLYSFIYVALAARKGDVPDSSRSLAGMLRKRLG